MALYELANIRTVDAGLMRQERPAGQSLGCQQLGSRWLADGIFRNKSVAEFWPKRLKCMPGSLCSAVTALCS